MSEDSNPTEEDYATPNRLAMYLEMGWSDFLLPSELTSRSQRMSGWPDPNRDAVRPDFYTSVANLCLEWCTASKVLVGSTCDIGAATGRLSYELAARMISLKEIVAVEPSIGFSDWARILLCEDKPLPPIPQLGPIGRERFAPAVSRPKPISSTSSISVSVVTATSEQYTSQKREFDLVTCLNVVDRHPEPISLVDSLSKLVKPSGILVCSSPLDFQSKCMTNGEAWTDSLHEFFSSNQWDQIGEAEVYYEFRYYNRVWTRFNCQVICKRKRAT